MKLVKHKERRYWHYRLRVRFEDWVERAFAGYSANRDARYLIILVSSMILVLLLLFNSIVRYQSINEVSIPAVVAIAAFLQLPWFMRIKRGRGKIAGIFVATIGAVTVPWAMAEEGGIFSVPIYWLTIVPMIAIYFSGIRWGLFFALVSSVVIGTFATLHSFGWAISEEQRLILPYVSGTHLAIIYFTAVLAGLSRTVEKVVLRRVRAREEEFRSLASNLPVMVWKIDPQGHLYYTNRSFDNFVAGRDVRMLPEMIHPRDRLKFFRKITVALNRHEPFEYTIRAFRDDGKVVWLNCACSPVGDRFFGLVGVCRDVTAQQERESDLQEARLRSERESKAKSKYLADLSRELKTPLSVVLKFAEMIEKGEALTTGARDYLKAIDSNARHLVDLLNKALEISKIEAGAVRAKPQPFSFENKLMETLETYRPLAEAKGLSFVISFAQGFPVNVLGDLVKVRQIVANLVSNAIKFTDSGSIRIRFDYSVSDGLSAAGWRPTEVYCFIEDTGSGFEGVDPRQVFQPFVLGRSAKGSRGSGLSLALSKNLAEVMGGDLRLNSTRPGSGSEFVLRLPLNSKSEAPEIPIVTKWSREHREPSYLQ